MIVLVARFQKSVKTQIIMVVRPYTSMKEIIAKYIRNTLLSRKQTAKIKRSTLTLVRDIEYSLPRISVISSYIIANKTLIRSLF